MALLLCGPAMRVRVEPLGYADGERGESEPRVGGRAEATAFERLFATEFSALKRYLARFVGAADAEELSQEAFTRVYGDGTARIESPRGFLFQTARNLAVSHIRRRKMAETAVQGLAATDPVDGGSPSVEETLQHRQDFACVQAAIAHLPERRREIFLMRFKEGLSYAEIADNADISIKSVESHLARGVEACQSFFEQCARRGCGGRCKMSGDA